MNDVIKKEKESSDQYCYNPIHGFHFNYTNMDDYLRAMAKTKTSEKEGSDTWNNLTVQHLDYLVNPTIKVKNSYIIESLVTSFIPMLG